MAAVARLLAIGSAGKHLVHQVGGDVAGAPGPTGGLFAGGSRQRIIARDNTTSEWTFVFNPNAATTILSLEGVPGGEVYAGALRDFGHQLTRLSDGEWSELSPGPDLNVFGLWAADANTWFAVGTDANNTGVIYSGTR